MTLDTKALEAAARAVDSSWFDGGPEFQDTESSYQAHCLDTARAAIEAYLSATPSRNDILEEAAAFKAGQAEAEARIADLLKDPAAVRVNYLRGGIACQTLINEALEEAARVAEAETLTGEPPEWVTEAQRLMVAGTVTATAKSIAAAIRALVKP